MDINCEGISSDYIEMSDGYSMDSPLMARFCGNGSNVPDFMQTSQNHMRIRWNLMQYEIGQCLQFGNHFRFFSNYFASGHGFQLKYESTNLSPSMWSFMVDDCGDGGYYSTNGGSIQSPSYPGNYPDYADCIYTISQPTETVILLNFLSMDIHYYTWDGGRCTDYLEIRDGPWADSPLLDKVCGNEIPASIQSSQNQLWMRWTESERGSI